MGMFDKILHRDDGEKQQINAENRMKAFEREQLLVGAEAENDNTFLHLQNERADLTRWQQDLDDSIEELKRDLLNHVRNEKGEWVPDVEIFKGKDGKFYQQPVRPEVNIHGTNEIISLVKRYLSRSFMMSNLNDTIIFRMLRRLRVDLVLHLGSKYEAYEIDPDHLSLIVKKVMDPIEATLYRAMNNGERNYLNTINKRVETFSVGNNPQPQKKSLLGVFN